jgi:hypothetical protein
MCAFMRPHYKRFLDLDSFCVSVTHTLMPTKLLSSTAKTEGYVIITGSWVFSLTSSDYHEEIWTLVFGSYYVVLGLNHSLETTSFYVLA